MLNGRDVSNLPIEVRSGDDISGLRVTFTDRTAEISGRLIAAEDVERVDLDDAALLSQLLTSAYQVTLAEGEKVLRDLRIGG